AAVGGGAARMGGQSAGTGAGGRAWPVTLGGLAVMAGDPFSVSAGGDAGASVQAGGFALAGGRMGGEPVEQVLAGPGGLPGPCGLGAAAVVGAAGTALGLVAPVGHGGHSPDRRRVRVLRQPNGPGRSKLVVRRPVLLIVWRGPDRPPNVIDQERRLMFSRTPGRIRKLLRNVIGMTAS